MVQMGRFAGRRPAQLSGGQQQRIALARALVFEPELVLMDEPLGALDKQLREHMQFEIKHLHERLGVTVVYVTHDQSEALTMSDRIAVFNDGAHPAARRRPRSSTSARRTASSPSSSARTTRSTARSRRSTAASLHGAARRRSSDRRAAGQRLRSPATGRIVSIRPERVEFRADRLPPGTHTLEAEVLEFIYMGDTFRTRLRVAGNDNFIMKCRNSRRPAPPRRRARRC